MPDRGDGLLFLVVEGVVLDDVDAADGDTGLEEGEEDVHSFLEKNALLNGSGDAWREGRVEAVKVERNVDAVEGGGPVKDEILVEDGDARLPDSNHLLFVHVSDSEVGELERGERREDFHVAVPAKEGDAHAVQVSCVRGGRSVEVCVSIHPEDAHPLSPPLVVRVRSGDAGYGKGVVSS